jgi:hypothetical protein
VLASAVRAADDGVVDGRVLVDGAPAAAHVEIQRVGDVGTDHVPTRFHGHDPTDIAPWATSPVLATVAAGADGRFHAAGLADGTYRLTAVREDGARESRFVDVTAGAPATVEIATASGGFVLRGRAVHADGTPFRGWIAAYWLDVHDAWTPTGEDGSFRFAGIEDAKASLVAVRPGETMASGPTVALPRSDEFVFTVDVAGGPELHGFVVEADGGKAIPGATVYLAQAAPGLFGETAVRGGPDGQWRAKAWSACRVYGVAPGFRWGETSYSDGAGKERFDAKRDLPIRLDRTVVVTGRVTRADGSPVAGAVVRSRSWFWPNSPWDAVETRTAADGAYRIEEVDAGSAAISPGAIVYVAGGGFVTPGLAGTLSQSFETATKTLGVKAKPGGTATRDLVVEPGGRAVVRVVDDKGAPVAGALVSAAWMPTSGDNFGFEVGVPTLPSRTDADGRVVAGDLVPDGAYTFQADAPGRPRVSAAPTKVKSGAESVVEIRVPAR